jgi:TonB C terminal
MLTYAEIKFGVGNDGKIYEPEIVRYSGNDQYDAECLEAVCGVSPVRPAPKKQSAWLEFEYVKFVKGPLAGSQFVQPGYDGTDIKRYLAHHPHPTSKDPSDAFVLVHRIPLNVLERYPGMFTKEELLNPENLFEIPVGVGLSEPDSEGKRSKAPYFVRSIGNLAAFWTSIFVEPNVTKQTIIETAKSAEVFSQH